VPRPNRLLADQALTRAAGGPLVDGNAVRVLRDARENYPAWLDAIHGAQRWIHFETCILRDDTVGRQFGEAMMARARDGVRVRLIYDWFGNLNKTSWRFWRTMREAGIEVRVFNRPRLDDPLGWVSRDHRKVLTVDGHTGFVSGLCVGDVWVGNPEKRMDPWRDTGIGIVGPAVADVEEAFAAVWAKSGAPLPDDERLRRDEVARAGTVSLRVIDTVPTSASILRLDQLVAALARRTLWISDAYFVGVSTYVQSLLSAAADGVDVRLLVPGSGSDVVWVQHLTRAGYRALLEGGIRVFEWNGPMMHAKTAVADGQWARIGSTNLNLSSWIGNYEMDVAIDDAGVARAMEVMFEDDLGHATEIVLERRRVRPAERRARRGIPVSARLRRSLASGGSTSRAAAGALRLGSTFGAAITARRPVGAAEAFTLAYGAMALLGLAALGYWFPKALALPLSVVMAWIGVSWLIKSWRLLAARRRERAESA
jgi:cardiolipin synthase